tara:strand:+ start:115 stop:795 length:681 start_codon:yes stop_codon:yes gene_type:complete
MDRKRLFFGAEQSGGYSPIFEGDSNSLNGSSSTTLSVAYPSGIQADNIILLWLNTNRASTWTVPSGFTLIKTTSISGFSYALFYKRATGTESGNLSVTASGYSTGGHFGIMSRYSGCIKTGIPYEELTFTPINNDVGSITHSNSNSLGDNRLACVFLTQGQTGNFPTITFNNYTVSYSYQNGAGGNTRVHLGTQDILNSSTDDGNASVSWGGTNDAVGVGILLIPN